MTIQKSRLYLDPVLLTILLVICLGGLLILYSASGRNVSMITRQAIYMGGGFIVALIIARVDPVKIRHWAFLFYGISVFLLLIVLLAGAGAKGATRWIAVPGLRFQPSELMKRAMPLTIAACMSRQPLPCGYRQILLALILTGVPVVLIASQPDLGTALLVGCTGLFVIFLAGFRFRDILVLAVLSVPVLWIMWHFLMHDYQRQRVLTLFSPERDPLGAGWHIIQAKIAIGSGGLFGKGYLHGSQSHLNFLPESHTDFIFAVLAEEFGLIGVGLLLSAYTLLAGRGIYIAMTGQSTFIRLAAGGIILTFCVYVIVNIGMVCGLLPVVGVPLPLISRGGTSVISMMAGFGLLMSFHTHRQFISR